MRERGQPEIRLLGEADIPAAMRLKELARWNQTESDWLRLLRLEPEGCFCAVIDGQLAGTATTITYGNELAWIGMVLVDPEYRRRGIATRLMETALEYLSNRVEVIKLDATPDGQLVYENLGFQTESLVERWAGCASSRATASDLTLRTLASRELFALDRRAFSADRSPLIASLMADASVATAAAIGVEGWLSGYALARPGDHAAYVGPLVADDAGEAAALLDQLLNRLAGQSVYIDINTGFKGAAEVLAERGFGKQRELIRMVYGPGNSSPTSSSVFAIAGPEVG